MEKHPLVRLVTVRLVFHVIIVFAMRRWAACLFYMPRRQHYICRHLLFLLGYTVYMLFLLVDSF